MTVLFHATDVNALPAIMAEGLTTVEDHPIHLCELDSIEEFIHDLGADTYESENGYPPVTITLAVDVTGLDLDGPRAEEFGPDNPEHHMCWETITPNRLRIVKVYHGVA